MASAAQEVRIDPEDGVGRTLEELRRVCQGHYSEQQIQEYWEMVMIPSHGENIHSVSDDPFLTRAQGRARTTGAGTMTQKESGGPVVTQRPPSAPASPRGQSARTLARSSEVAEMELPRPGDVSVDPFLTSDRNKDVADTRQDPFLTHGEHRTPAQVRANYDPTGAMGRRQQVAQAAAAAKKHWTESMQRLLGPGDPDRNPQVRNIVIFGPWLFFLWVLCIWLVLQHYSKSAVVALTIMCVLGSLSMMFVWYVGRRGGPVSMLTLGALFLVACVAGTAAGSYGWERFFRQYWWTQTGFQGGATTAVTPALARSDFAILDFWDDASSSTYNETRVEPSMAAGFKDTDFYCVAPILDPRAAMASLKRVNYWAVGVNCCQRYGYFTCDDSRTWDAGQGVVMLEGGWPCPTCNVDKFRKAVTKAEAAHGLVSADGAVFVRWVKEPSSVITAMLIEAVAYLMLCAFLGLAASGLLGWLAWYYGLGLRKTGDLFGLDLGRSNVILDASSLAKAQQKLTQ